MHRYLSGLAAIVVITGCASQPPAAPASLSPAELAVVAGDGWTGELTYRDYSPPYGSVKLAVEARVTAVPDGISVALHYPREPHADSESVLSLSADGRTFDGKTVTGQEQRGDTLTITTEARCEDDGLPATCQHVYTLAPRAFGWVKLVTLDKDGTAFQRNAYAFKRKDGG